MSTRNRREFLRDLCITTGSVVLVPAISACSLHQVRNANDSVDSLAVSLDEIPRTEPADWDPIAYNRIRGNAGAIPRSYLDEINGSDGEKNHLGKHLPYVPNVGGDGVPDGYIAVMWGNPALDHARHPNAVPGLDNDYEGHWYNWIRIRRATSEDAIELQSEYTSWPGTNPDDSGSYAVFGDQPITSDSGKNTIYLAALPADVHKGERVRIHAHCLTHGEYVDFITV